MKVIFIGTPVFATKVLDYLLNNNVNVVAVVTIPDKKAGRGHKLTPPPMKRYAQEKGLPVLQPENLKDDSFLSRLRSFGADLFIVFAFPILPREVWQMPPLGTINLHPSYLPQYRGAAPVNWPIINGETETGVSIIFINDKVDQGNIILQEKMPIEFTDTASTLLEKLVDRGKQLLLKAIEQIERGEVKVKKQVADGELKKAPKITKEMTFINWDDDVIKIYNFIRGMSEQPTARTKILKDGKELLMKIYFAEPVKEQHNLPLKTVLTDKKNFKIAVKNGFINLKDVQLEGKKRMDIEEFLRGFNYKELKLI